MISVSEATQLILSTVRVYPAEQVSLGQAKGRVLREKILADRDFPPYDRVTMDGIAIKHAAWAAGQRIFNLQGRQTAGQAAMALQSPEFALEIMTGAVLSKGTDSVIRYEDLDIKDGQASILASDIRLGQNVHAQGSDQRIGTTLVDPGKKISAPEIAVAATVGMSQLLVSRRPRIAVLSTGDELVPVTEMPLPHQIRQSNAHMLSAILSSFAEKINPQHLPDDLPGLTDAFKAILDNHDVLVVSGGVSKGKADFIPEALADAGVKKLFHRVAQRPGKPFWFGKGPAGQPVFALPGNPVSSFVGAVRYVIPWLRASSGEQIGPGQWATLGADFTFSPPLTYFLQVRLEDDTQGKREALPVVGNGSGDFANLLNAQALLELPSDREVFQKGESYRLWPFS